MTRALAAALILAIALTANAAAQDPGEMLADIEDEVMCVQCGTPLNLSTAAVADREREFIRQEIASGKSKQEILDGLEARFGPSVLALPEDEGFSLAAYLVPVLVVTGALIAVVLAARRWRRPAAGEADAGGEPGALPPEDARRVENELAEFDSDR